MSRKDKEPIHIKISNQPEENTDTNEATEAAQNSDNETQELESEFSALQSELDKTKGELTELHSSFLRLRADFDNYRKRVRQEQVLDRQRGIEEFVMGLLPILDNFERAINAADQTQTVEAMAEGIKLIWRQLNELLNKHNIKPISAVGEPFDPNFHEAVQRVQRNDIKDGTVIEDVERGYLSGDKVIRPAKTIVAVNNTDEV